MDTAYSINAKNSILVSRNKPLALVVGVAGFIGSHIADALLSKNIQVIGIDDFSSGEKINLVNAVRNKDFHIINDSINNSTIAQSLSLKNLPRLDYAFFAANSENTDRLYSSGLLNFLHIIKDLKKELDIAHKPRIVFTSSIDLYNSKVSSRRKNLKEGEVRLAKFVKHYKLNARIIRLAHLFGPRMNFRDDNPVTRLIQASITGTLQSEQISDDYSSRNLFIDDAISLIIKATLSGATSQKIYDGAMIAPVKISEIKQILLDPLWHEDRDFKPSELPPWPTPNLKKTCEELSWEPRIGIVEALRKTVAYFKDNNVEVPKLDYENKKELEGRWSFKNYKEVDPSTGAQDYRRPEVKEKRFELRESDPSTKRSGSGGFRSRLGFSLVLLILFFGLVYPIAALGVGAFNIRNNLRASRAYLEEGNFERAGEQINLAKATLYQTRQTLNYLDVLKRIGILKTQVDKADRLVNLVSEGIDGVDHATRGSKALFQTTKIISGEDASDPKPLYQTAQTELTSASQIISKVLARLSDEDLLSIFPDFIRERNNDLLVKLSLYQNLVEKARAASFLMPEVTAVGGKKSFLLLLQNNLELRPTGGFIGSYGKLDFENGRLSNILVDDIYNLDGGLKDVIDPPQELRTDLGSTRWYLRDSNYDPDFPTSARQSEFFYRKESGQQVNGVIAMDLTASGKLLSAVGGLDLPEYGEHVDGNNLFERAVSHAEVGFFPGSQAKKNYLVSLQGQLFNKVFYLSKQNWPAIITAIGESLEQKHLMAYLSDPYMFSYITSSNWAGVMPRGGQNKTGEVADFLAVNESNMGANKSNYYLTRKYNLETSLTKEGIVMHKLHINYTNNSPSEVFPAGIYKNRLRVYLPLGTKITKALFGETDITSRLVGFSDYGRSAYSVYLQIVPKETKQLILEYSLSNPVTFSGDSSFVYRLDILKQPGTGKDPFEWQFSVPINFKAQPANSLSDKFGQEVTISTDLQKDRSFLVNLKKR